MTRDANCRDQLMPDPAGRVGGILTVDELEACLRVLDAVSEPVCASVLLTLSELEARAWVSLSRAGYVGTRGKRASVERFMWDRIAATPAGLRWAEQIREAGTRA